jgi:hypothetical protein
MESSCARAASVVPSHFGTIAAHRHRAPAPGSVSRAVVEYPATSRVPARAQPREVRRGQEHCSVPRDGPHQAIQRSSITFPLPREPLVSRDNPKPGQRTWQRRVESFDVGGKRRATARQPGEASVERLAQRDSLSQCPGCRLGTASGLTAQLPSIILRQELGLLCEPDELPVGGQVIDGRSASPPADRIGEVQTQGTVPEVERPRRLGGATAYGRPLRSVSDRPGTWCESVVMSCRRVHPDAQATTPAKST